MSEKPCSHSDIRKFDGIRCCLACGEAVFEASFRKPALHTVDATGHYKHTRLNYELSREIRIISLLPGDPGDTLRCEIAHVNLEDDPVYDAVSYTWATEDGDASLSSTIECYQCGAIPITRNCDIVLRQLRRPGIRRALWVDAICIDQANISERNHQVGLMDLIYRGARCVLICISDRVRRASSPDYAQLFRCLQDTHPITDQALEMFDVTSLLHLLSLRYFGRGWVIQEVALARAAFLIVNGHELSLNSSVMDRLKWVCRRHRLELPGVMMWTPGHRLEHDVSVCLYAGIRSKVSDPRDRIFAVLSLMKPYHRSLIPVDYSLDLRAVYTNAIIAVVTTQRNLDILLYASMKQELRSKDRDSEFRLDISGFESYLGDSVVNHLDWFYPARDPLASNHKIQPEWSLFKENCTGPWCSILAAVTASPSDYRDASLHKDKTFVVETPTLVPFGLLPRFRVRGHCIDWVVTINSGHPSSLSNDTVADRFKSHDHTVNQRDYKRFEATFLRGREKKGRHLFTSHFSLGFSWHWSPREGDSIFALDGARTLFVLRKIRVDTYRIVGPCYLWAALELDCWNPGTQKGRWGVGVERPNFEQTRMIEIDQTA